VFGIAERRLRGTEWTVERYSIADIHLFRLFWRFVNSVKPEPGDFPRLWARSELPAPVIELLDFLVWLEWKPLGCQ
jgi:glutathione S-transferase